MPESVEAGAGRPEGQRVVLSSRTRKGGEARRRGRRGPRDPASEQKLFVLRNRQIGGSRDGGGSRAAVAAQLAGEPGWDKGRAGRGWHGAAAFAAEGGTGVLRALRASGAPSPGRGRCASYGGAGVGASVLGAPRGAGTGGTRDCWGVARGTEAGPPGKGGDSGTTRRLRGRLNPENGGAAPVVAGLVVFLHANPGTTGTAIPACVPGVPHYARGRLHPAGRLRAGQAAEVAPRKVRAGVVVHTTHTPPPPPEERAREGAGHPWGLPGAVGAVRGPQSGRGCCRETIGPTLKTGVASWPGLRSLKLPQSSERYSGVGWKEHKLGHPPEPLGTPDFGATLRVARSVPLRSVVHEVEVRGLEKWEGVVRPRTGNPPKFLSDATRERRGTVVSQSFPPPSHRGRAALPAVGAGEWPWPGERC